MTGQQAVTKSAANKYLNDLTEGGGKQRITKDRIVATCTVAGCTDRHYVRGFCCRHYQQARRCGAIIGTWRDRRAHLIEDVLALIGTDTPRRIAARLGYERPASLAKRLTRAGRPDLAQPFWRAA